MSDIYVDLYDPNATMRVNLTVKGKPHKIDMKLTDHIVDLLAACKPGDVVVFEVVKHIVVQAVEVT